MRGRLGGYGWWWRGVWGVWGGCSISWGDPRRQSFTSPPVTHSCCHQWLCRALELAHIPLIRQHSNKKKWRPEDPDSERSVTRMSYLIPLNPMLFKNIVHVGSVRHFNQSINQYISGVTPWQSCLISFNYFPSFLITGSCWVLGVPSRTGSPSDSGIYSLALILFIAILDSFVDT